VKLGTVGGLIVPAPGADPNLGRIDRAAEMGLSVISIGFRDNRDPGYMQKVGEHAARKGVELRGGGTGGPGTFGSANPEERKAAVERSIESLLLTSKHSGIKFYSVANGPMSHNRWSPEPPMNERIDMIAEGLGAVADAVREAGVTLGLENHCDYRGWECAAMLEKANRPNLKAQIDTGNAFTVFEEPIDCAKAMAKWVVSVHLKDIRVLPLSGGRSIAETVPLGMGMVDNVTICEILAEQAPDPKSISLLQEPLTMPEEWARDGFLKVSTDWCRKALAKFID
jgi:sugar phosphate isomerase/epimerase